MTSPAQRAGHGSYTNAARGSWDRERGGVNAGQVAFTTAAIIAAVAVIGTLLVRKPPTVTEPAAPIAPDAAVSNGSIDPRTAAATR